MALTVQQSTKELARVANLAYEGETIKVALCNVGSTGYTAESTVTNWLTTEISGNGYSRFSLVLSTGAYDSVDARYEVPFFDAVFTASGSGFTYDRIVVYVDGATYPHSVITENPNIAMVAGQSKTYRILLSVDD
jgi:hypothetical protein